MFHPENNPELFQAFQRGDHAAFRQYHDLYYESVYGYLRYLTRDEVVAEEMVNEVFSQLYKSRGRISDGVHLWAFLLLTAKTLFRDHIRVQTRGRQLKSHLSRQPEYAFPESGDERDKEEVIKDLERSISDLTERRREVLELHYFQGLPIKDIARRLSLSEHTINNTLAQTLKILRGELFRVWGKKNPGLS